MHSCCMKKPPSAAMHIRIAAEREAVVEMNYFPHAQERSSGLSAAQRRPRG